MDGMTTESQRNALEDLERLEGAIADRLADNSKSWKRRLAREHEIAGFIERIKARSQFLSESFEDADGASKKEVELLSGGGGGDNSIEAIYDGFYSRLQSIKDFHRRNPDQRVQDYEEEYKHTDDKLIDNKFSGEEGFGRFLDQVEFHEMYVNLKGVPRLTYLQYLDSFDDFAAVPVDAKNASYLTYLVALSTYLESFLRRVKPLSSPEAQIRRIQDESHTVWRGVQEDPLYCTVCDRRYSKQTVFDAHVGGNRHKKLASEKGTANGTGRAKSRQHAIAEYEYRVAHLAELLKGQRQETKTNVERKQSLTESERQLELEADSDADHDIEVEVEGDPSDQEDGQDDKLYNPLKIPLGWDGRPIPYWMYKLHGLGVEFSCEICGNHVYMGQRAYEKHFMEFKHTHGLKCLGIQNSVLFKDVTQIQDAVHLWEAIKLKKRKQDSEQEATVEMEDDDGNVMTARLYEDLKKQGLL